MDFYRETPELHKLPKYKSRSKGIRQGRKGAPEIEAAFLIPVVFTVQNHRFEVHTLICDISPEHDLVIGIQNMFEVEGELSARECVFRWTNKSMPLMVNDSFTVKPSQRKTIQAYIPFPQKLHGKATATANSSITLDGATIIYWAHDLDCKHTIAYDTIEEGSLNH